MERSHSTVPAAWLKGALHHVCVPPPMGLVCVLCIIWFPSEVEDKGMLMFNDCFTVARPCVAGSELAGYMEAQAAVAIYLGFQEPTCRVHTEGADAMVSAFQGTGYCGLTLGPLLCAGAMRECRTTQAVFQSRVAISCLCPWDRCRG